MKYLEPDFIDLFRMFTGSEVTEVAARLRFEGTQPEQLRQNQRLSVRVLLDREKDKLAFEFITAAEARPETPAADAPLVVGHLGQSLDGFIATREGNSRYINCDDSLHYLHRLRALSDAVVIGVGTAVADSPRAVILPQVTFGIAMRMAVMSVLAGGGA